LQQQLTLIAGLSLDRINSTQSKPKALKVTLQTSFNTPFSQLIIIPIQSDIYKLIQTFTT